MRRAEAMLYSRLRMLAAIAALTGCGSRTGLDAPIQGSPGDAATTVVRDATAPGLDAETTAACGTPSCQPFPTFDDQCLTAADCALALHGCCNRLAVGVLASRLAAFNAAEATWSSVCCATVDCAPTMFLCSAQGVLCSRGTTLSCVGGRCRTGCQ